MSPIPEQSISNDIRRVRAIRIVVHTTGAAGPTISYNQCSQETAPPTPTPTPTLYGGEVLYDLSHIAYLVLFGEGLLSFIFQVVHDYVCNPISRYP